MRHGTLELTTQTYTALKLLEVVEALKALPDSPLDYEPRTEREQAAETDATACARGRQSMHFVRRHGRTCRKARPDAKARNLRL
jgi:hypothetical protein